MPNVIEDNKMSFNAITYEINDTLSKQMKKEDWDLLSNNQDEFLKKYYIGDIKVINNRFTLVNENNVWKVDEFILPF